MTTQDVILAVRAVIALPDERILFIQRSDGSHRNPGLWEVPGGGIASGEPIDVALKREIREETGILVSPSHSKPLIFVSPVEKNVRYVELIFRCPPVQDENIQLSSEHQAFRWLKVEDTLRLPLAPTARELVEYLL